MALQAASTSSTRVAVQRQRRLAIGTCSHNATRQTLNERCATPAIDEENRFFATVYVFAQSAEQRPTKHLPMAVAYLESHIDDLRFGVAPSGAV